MQCQLITARTGVTIPQRFMTQAAAVRLELKKSLRALGKELGVTSSLQYLLFQGIAASKVYAALLSPGIEVDLGRLNNFHKILHLVYTYLRQTDPEALKEAFHKVINSF